MPILMLMCALGFAGSGMNMDIFPPKQANRSQASPPPSVELLSPAPRSAASQPVQLSWKASAEATHYHVQVASDPNFKWLVRNDQKWTQTELSISELASGQTYYWRVWPVSSKKDAGFTKGRFSASSFRVQ